MAEGALRRSGATYALSTTGIAGPDGGTDLKPVGTVFIGLAQRGSSTLVESEFFPTDRPSFKRICTQHALEMLRRRILEEEGRIHGSGVAESAVIAQVGRTVRLSRASRVALACDVIPPQISRSTHLQRMQPWITKDRITRGEMGRAS